MQIGLKQPVLQQSWRGNISLLGPSPMPSYTTKHQHTERQTLCKDTNSNTREATLFTAKLEYNLQVCQGHPFHLDRQPNTSALTKLQQPYANTKIPISARATPSTAKLAWKPEHCLEYPTYPTYTTTYQ